MSDEAVTDTLEAPPADAGTGDAGLGAAETQAPAEGTPAVDAATIQPTEVETSDKADTPTSSTPADKAPPQKGDDFVPASRYKELQAEFTRRTQAEKERARELEEIRSQLERFKGIDPEAVAAFQASKAKPVWNPSSPEYTRFLAAQERLKVINSLGVENEEKMRLARQHLTEDELRWVSDWGAHQRELQQRMLEDPAGYVQSLVKEQLESTVQERLNGFAAQQQTYAAVEATFSSPEFRSLYLTPDGRAKTEHGARLEQLMAAGVPYETADKVIRAEVKAAKLEAENAALRKQTATASERTRLLKDGATDVREVRVGGDLNQEAHRIAKAKGIALGSPAFLDLLINLSNIKQ